MADLDRLLDRSSRTFALSIPLLPSPTRREVSVAYLLFRIADTFEDATRWEPARRIRALAEFCALLKNPSLPAVDAAAQRWVADPPCDHEGYLELLAEAPDVFDDFLDLSPAAIAEIRDRVIASAEGMAGFVARSSPEGELRLAHVADLRAYCYVVAGIVGEMLTSLFLLDRPELSAASAFLSARAARFGEGLQLVNILKDAGSDRSEGRSYLPDGVARDEVFALARADLRDASQYVLALQQARAPRGIVGFTALPVELAWETLDRVEKHGPGSKVPRPRVALIVSRLNRDLDRNRPAVRARDPRK
jgi:farnesyl-diphosphate farnesyltransferase